MQQLYVFFSAVGLLSVIGRALSLYVGALSFPFVGASTRVVL